ncbi:hypothetical protein NC653_002570 [Populus alba x Populus x berolinensis]|uniref:Uncharacterized protein n=1 Tax=Populus alba x Populus x berolinensis TaxID=444605 RepID=A0AAD6RP65_9ROSI|nr:hypothetical protein NC653_002570 [Populus alba x Populus x berolinensis]
MRLSIGRQQKTFVSNGSTRLFSPPLWEVRNIRV